MRKALLAAGLLIGAAACSGGPSSEGAYERGLAALESGQPRTARIELMNALKADPMDGKARIAQARTYLALGEGAAAQSELLRAREAGVAVEETRHLMAQALLLMGEPHRALGEAAEIPPAHAAYGARIRGGALMALGDMAAAAAAFDEALAAAEADSEVWLDIARFRRAGGELGGAIEAADRSVALDPRNGEALVLRGELTRNQYGLQAALAWFDRALEIDPHNVTALLERAATYGDMGRMKAMLADTRNVLSLAPANPMAWHLQAVLAARARNWPLARSLQQRTGGAFDDQPSGMLLAGAIDLQTGNAERAVNRLERLVAIQPGNGKARRLLAAAQWRAGDPAATAATLRPLADRADADSYVLSLMARALAARGDEAGAAAYLARAAQPHLRRSTALAAGPPGPQELDVLRRAAADRPGDAPARIALVSALLAQGRGGEALDHARAVQAANSGAPEAHILVGDALGTQGQFRAAAEEYRKAANLAFTEPVAMRLIEALQRSGQSAAAGQVLDLFLHQNPRNVSALMLAAGRHMQARRWNDAIELYEGLRLRIGDRDATILNNLAWAYAETGDYKTAVPLARRAWGLQPDNPATADTLGWLLFKSGESRAEGLALLERAARGAPSDREIRRRLEQARRG